MEYSPVIAAFLKARGSREPEDLTSEVFLAAFDALPQFVGGEPQFRSFLFSIAYRRLTDEFRKRSRWGENVQWSEDDDRRTSPSAEEAALERWGNSAALSLLDGLAADQRTVMVLRIVADLTIEQIAEVLGKRPGAVKALQRRALESLRKKIQQDSTLFDPSSDSRE